MEHKTRTERLAHKRLPVILCLLAVILFYALFVISGSVNHSGTTTIYYTYLAEAFLNGQLDLRIEPDPHLLAAENPYDPLTRLELERVGIITPMDFSLYGGNFYLYWGPVPALILAVTELFSIEPVSDLFVAFGFVVGIFLVQSLYSIALWEHYFCTLPKWMLYLALFLGGSLWPIALLRHYDDYARIYEAAIAGGQFFLMAGLLVALTAIMKPTIQNWRLVFATSLWALAIGTRFVLAVPIGLMTAMTAFWVARIKSNFVEKVASLIALGLPLALGFAALSWYNWARFSSIGETGFSYALAGVNLQGHATELFSASYIIQNLYNYLFNRPDFISQFPFISMLDGITNPVLSAYRVPDFYHAQQITGLLYLFPFAAFAAVPVITLLANLFKGRSATHSFGGHNIGVLAWLAITLGGSFLIAFCLLMVFFWVGTRYLGDFAPAMTALSLLGFWQGYQLSAGKPLLKNLYIFTAILLASVSILMSTLLAISINPGLIDLITEALPFFK